MFKWLIKELNRESKSKNIAKNRLQLVLIQDRASANEKVVESLQSELYALLSRYFELDPSHIEIDLHREDESIALIANVPIYGFKPRSTPKTEQQINSQVHTEATPQSSKRSTASATPSL